MNLVILILYLLVGTRENYDFSLQLVNLWESVDRTRTADTDLGNGRRASHTCSIPTHLQNNCRSVIRPWRISLKPWGYRVYRIP
jgi:hypothetical protein